MKKILFLFLAFYIWSTAGAQVILSDKAEISLLTSAPYDEEVFTVYGHAALRIHDPERELDLIFNYGIFDFSKPNFIYRFAKGETDYMLGVANFPDYVIEYQMRGSDITEQVLNLLPGEKARIWSALLENYQPENRVYRYNFFFDNCATRLATLAEKNVYGEIRYNDPLEPKTFRELINYCTRNHPWLTFGCDLALGSPTDRTATPHEMMFLPFYLKEAFGKATVIQPDGIERPLVKHTRTIGAAGSETDRAAGSLEAGGSKEATEEKATNAAMAGKPAKNDTPAADITKASEGKEESRTMAGPIEENDSHSAEDTLFTPMVASLLLFLLVFILTFREWRKKIYFRWLDCVLFFVAGAGGVILFFLSFISVHPATWPNWSLIWLNPLDLVAVILFCVKKARKAAYYYHFINFAALSMMLAGWYWIPQHLNTAFIPLVATLWLRSGYGIYRKKWKIG